MVKDSCVLTHNTANEKLIVAIYVDDRMICSNNVRLLEDVLTHLKTKFEVTIMDPSCFVGLQIYRDRSKKTLTINQAYYIEKIVER